MKPGGGRGVLRFAALAIGAWTLLEPLRLGAAVLPPLQAALTVAAEGLARLFEPAARREAFYLLNADGHATVFVAPECVGLSTIVLYLCAIAAAPGAVPRKLAAAIGGAVVLFGLSAGRIAALHLTLTDHRALFDNLHAELGAILMIAAAVALFFLAQGRAAAAAPEA